MLERLERIEGLRETGAGPAELLAELRALVREGERWATAERSGTRAARAALDALEARVAACGRAGGAAAATAGREVVPGKPG